MPDVTNELLYEVLKTVQDRLTKIEDGQRDIREEIIGVRLHMHAMQGKLNSLFVGVGSVEDRLVRIERRLDLSGEPAE